MKLYATVGSDRAIKGQGGKYLEIVIHDHNYKEAAILRVEKEHDTVVIYYDLKPLARLQMFDAENGKRQKGES